MSQCTILSEANQVNSSLRRLADLGVAQADIEMDGILAHPDIMSE